MKKIISLLLVVGLVLSSATLAFANENEISVYVEGQKVSFDVPPQTINDRTMVPIRAIFEVMGATVNWDNATQTAICTKDNSVVKMTLNIKTEYINDVPYEMDVAPVIVDNRTLAPARYVAEAFGYFLNWDGNTKSVLINKTSTIKDGTKEQKVIFEKEVKEKEEMAKDKEFYDLIFEKFPEIAPKSFGGYRRMKASNSENYKKLLLKAEELLGYNFYDKQ